MTRTPLLAATLCLWALACPARAADPGSHAHHDPAPEGRGPDSRPLSRPASRPTAWTAAPLLLPAAGGMARGSARFSPQNLATDRLEVFGPDKVSQGRVFPLEEGVANLTAEPKAGNYHWVVAREQRTGEERVATTAWYVSNPGPAPTQLLAESRPGLMVLPRLPREHGGYREGEKWDFLVRLDGKPVPGAALTLETEFGTRTRGVADGDGLASLVFPRDFDPARLAPGGHGGRPSARFVVAAQQEQDGLRRVAAFNGTYGPEPGRSRNLMAGVGFLLLGMAAAAPLLRRKEEKQ